MTRRRGFSLVELLVVLSMMAIVLVLCVGLIHTLLRLDRAARAQVAEDADLSRLAREFRRDVRAATALEPIPFAAGPSTWLPLALPGGRTVEYRSRGNTLIRSERTAEAILRTETFRLPSRVAVRWEIEGTGDRTVVGLVLDPPPGREAGPAPAGHRIEGVLGQDHRFARLGD